MGIIAPEIQTYPDIREFGPWALAGSQPGGFLTDNREGETLERALAALAKEAPRGGEIVIPRGDARIFTTPNFKGVTNTTIVGAGGIDGSGGFGGEAGAASRIIYAEKGERAWDFRNSYTSGATNVQFLADNPAFAGKLVDLAGAQIWDFTKCSFQPNSSPTLNSNTYGIFCAQANSGSFNKCKFTGCGYGAVGRTEGAQFSAAITFNNCFFSGNINRHVLNAHQGWWFNNCIFENLVTNKGVTTGVGALVFTEPCPGQSVTFEDCFFGNSGAVGWHIEYRGSGLIVVGGEGNWGEGFMQTLGETTYINIQPSVLKKMAFGVALNAACNKFTYRPGLTELVTTPVFGAASIVTPNIGAKTERAVNTEFEPPVEDSRPTQVSLTIECKAALATKVEGKVGGVFVNQAATGVDVSGVTVLSMTFLVPPGKKWELKVVEGTVEKLFSTYQVTSA